MNTYLSSSQLKDEAKNRLTGHYGLLIGCILLNALISFLASLFLIVPTAFAGIIVTQCIQFIISVFQGVLVLGSSLIYLKLAVGNSASVSDLFYGFTHNIQRTLAVSLVISGLNFIPNIITLILRLLFSRAGIEVLIFILLLSIALELIILVPLGLGLSQCYYLMLDFPSKSASEIISLSFKIMKGQKARLFYIEVSFIPLILLGLLSGIGILWIAPYSQMTHVCFFLDIMKKEQKN